MERERVIFWILYTCYLLSIVKIKREIERKNESEKDRKREREKERDRKRKRKRATNNIKCDKKV